MLAASDFVMASGSVVFAEGVSEKVCKLPTLFLLLKGPCLLLLLRIRSAHLEIVGFPMGGAY